MARKAVERRETLAAVAYSYIRFSRPEQAGGDSVRRQTALTRDWCRRNGVPLDESLTFHDFGVSGFTGEHRSNPDRHALASFLQMVKDGQVRPGSFLVIESLDRLSREHVRAGMMLLLGLIEAGVRIVQLVPEYVYDQKADDFALMIAIAELRRGHAESAMKSKRCGEAWAAKKRDAAREKRPITRVVPAWVEVQGGGFRLIPEKAEAVRRVYRMARDGCGVNLIVKTLNTEGVPAISQGKRRGRYWSSSYVAHILSTRATIGEYQPHKGKWRRGNPKARQPDGPPIPNYFPAVVTEDEWHATRAAVTSRRTAVGRPSQEVNVFKNLLTDARTRTAMHSSTRGRCPAVIYPYAFTLGKSRFMSFPLTVFEAAILSQLKEIDPTEVLPPPDGAADRVMVLAGRLAEVDTRIEKVKAAAVDGEDIAPLLDLLKRLDVKRQKLAADLARARQETATPAVAAWDEAKTLIDALAAAPDRLAARTRLRAMLKRVVAEIWVLVVPRGRDRLCAVQVWFAGSASHRDFLIFHRPGHPHGRELRPPAWWVRTFKEAKLKPGDLDLRNHKDTAALEAVLLRTTDVLKADPG